MTPAQAARHFAMLAAEAPATEHLGRTLMAEEVKRSVKATYGDAKKLAELAPSTQNERVRLGYAANEPLLRDGTLLRDSIKIDYTTTGFQVGSTEQVAEYQEFGFINARTGRPVPARPAVAKGAAEARPELISIMEATAMAILGKARSLKRLALSRIVDDDLL